MQLYRSETECHEEHSVRVRRGKLLAASSSGIAHLCNISYAKLIVGIAADC